MAKKDQSFKRKIMPYILLAFSILSVMLIMLELYTNLR